MKKYTLFRFGHCYINQRGDFVIALLRGNKKCGYEFAASHANPSIFLGKIQSLSRIIKNDGLWIEIEPHTFNVASTLHAVGCLMGFHPINGRNPTISKY